MELVKAKIEKASKGNPSPNNSAKLANKPSATQKINRKYSPCGYVLGKAFILGESESNRLIVVNKMIKSVVSFRLP